MAKLAKKGSRTQEIRARANDFIHAAGLRSLHSWMLTRFRFVPDPPGLELLKEPAVMLAEWRQYGRALGDCDDAAILAASMALAMGATVRFIVLGFERRGPLAHVYAEARGPGGRWCEFDVTRPAQYPADLRVHRRLVFNL